MPYIDPHVPTGVGFLRSRAPYSIYTKQGTLIRRRAFGEGQLEELLNLVFSPILHLQTYPDVGKASTV